MRGPLRRIVARLRDVPRALWIVLALGVILRVAVALTIRPVALTLLDSELYVLHARDELFGDPTRPAGYTALLRALHALSADVDLTIAVQHVTGLATACLVFAGARRLGAGPPLAAVAALPVAGNLDAIFLEHAVMSETFFIAAIVGGAYAAIRALTATAEAQRWLVLAGLAFGTAAVLRSILVPLLPLLVVWATLASAPGTRRRLAAGAALAAGALVVPVTYATANAVDTGRFAITPRGAGLYSRVAPIADCREFTPPVGTAVLCERTPTPLRPGPDYYAWEPGSPAIRLFGSRPTDERLTRFAKQVVLHQPLTYTRTALRDVARYFVPLGDKRPFSGVGMTVLDLDRRDDAEPQVLRAVNAYYDDEHPRVRGGASTLAAIQGVLRITPLVTTALTLLTLVALIAGAGAVRRYAALALLLALGQLFVSAFSTIYSARYALPVVPLLAIAAVTARATIGRTA